MTDDIRDSAARLCSHLFTITDAPEKDCGDSHDYWWIAVWADDEETAMAFAGGHYDLEGGRFGEDQHKLRIESTHKACGLLWPAQEGPHAERRNSVVRLAGWSCEDDDMCDSCGLYEMDDDKYRVCCECRRCPECRQEEQDDPCDNCV